MDFAALNEAFFEESVMVPAKLGRIAAAGRYHDGVILVVFAMLGTEALSIISMRRASRKERRLIDG